MKVAYFPDAQRPGWHHPVVALGNFDGLHRGHQRLIDDVRRRAAERAGLDAAVVVRFTPDVARWEPELFVETVLVDWLRVSEVLVGANFLFGRDRSGTFTLLRTLGQDRGFRAENIEPVFYKDFIVSSTRVRRLIEEGRVDEAGALLGHHYFIDGLVVQGDGRGRQLGFPTANLRTDNELVPANGIYASIAIVDGAAHAAATSIGVRPTIGDGQFTVETFLLDGRHDLYGKRLRVAFVLRLRPEMKFESLDALVAGMTADVARVRALFAATAL